MRLKGMVNSRHTSWRGEVLSSEHARSDGKSVILLHAGSFTVGVCLLQQLVCYRILPNLTGGQFLKTKMLCRPDKVSRLGNFSLHEQMVIINNKYTFNG